MKPCSAKYLLTIPALLFPLLWLTSLAPATTLADESTEADARLQSVRKAIRDLQATLEQKRTRQGELQASLQRLETELGRLSASIRDIDHKLESGKRRLRQLGQRRDTLDDNLNEQRRLLAEQVRAAYAMGRQEQLKMLLNQQDPARLGRMMVYYDYFNRARAQRIEEVNATLRELDSVEREINRENAALAELRAQKVSEQETLAEGRAARKELLQRIGRELKTEGRRLATLKEDEQRLVRLLEELARRPTTENVERTSFAKLRGKLNWPTQGKISARFGERRPVGSLRWQGVLITAPEGREVRAISHGRVAFADWLRGFGLLMIVDHGEGFMSLYGHNQSLFKETGEWVEPGEVIASVGTSGGQSVASLYFEIRQDGRPVNPQRWCRRPQGLKVGMNWRQ
ncbi:MAG: peptidoglycan DD-metalloendopeptidase family protein [Gammaproteobacteria bacterium]